MHDGLHVSQTRPLGAWSSSGGMVAILVGLLVLIGWMTNLEGLKRVLPGLVAMNPMTALLFVLLGASLLFRQRPPDRRRASAAAILAGLVVATAAAKLLGVALGLQWGVDTWLFSDRLASPLSAFPNRMAPNTAVNFVLLGLAILLLDATLPGKRRPSEFLAALAALISLLALLGYFYRIKPLVGFSSFIPMALHTAMTFLLTAWGVLAARPKVGWMALVTGSGPGGALVRLLLPALIAMLIAIGWLRVQGENMGWFGPDLGITLYTVAVITLCVALTLWSAYSLDSAASKQSSIERQREEAFSELKQSEARIRSIVDTAYDAFISIDADGRVIDWNVAAEKMFGHLRSECIGKNLSQIIIPERFREAHDAGLACARSPEGATGRLLDRRVQMTALRRNGDEFPIQMTIWQLMIGANRTYNAFIGDITDRTIAERNIQLLNSQLITKASQLEISNRELEAFSYSISHDLRAPLRHIDGYAQMLAEDSQDQLDSEGRRYLQEIGAAARRMGALIDSLLAFSRLGRKPVQRAVVDMQALVEHVVSEEFSATSDKISIDELPSAHADATLLKQVWVNLISNALKYSAPRGDEARVHISGDLYPEFCRYQIRDNGVGFDMRYADKLFGVFQRLHTDDEFDGAGVGLAIVQRIVSRHDGTIEAQGEPGKGATFVFDLPGMAGTGHTVHAEERVQ